MLWQSGIRYRLHSKLPGTPDLTIASRKLAVFVDGCFWHGCPFHYSEPATNVDFWRRKLSRNQERDGAVGRALESMGWSVRRLWEHEIPRDEDDVSRFLTRLLTNP